MTDRDLPLDTPQPPADDLWAEALEGACEAERVEHAREHAREHGLVRERLSAGVRARALAAFEEVAADELVADALEGGYEAELVVFQRADRAAPLGASVRAAALAAFDHTHALPSVTGPALAAPAVRRGVRAEPLRARRLAPLLTLRPAAVAAVLLVGLGLGLLLAGGGVEAEAGLQLRALARVDTAGTMRMSQVQPRYFAALDHVFVPGRDELLSFRFADDAMIVVGGGDAVRVARPGPATPSGARYDAVLRLESGEARLATRAHPVPLAIGGVGMLVLEEGAAHVAVDAAGGVPAVALAERSVARFHRADGSAVPLTGPTRVLLAADGPQAFGAPARSLFHELRFFGGPLPEPVLVRTVAPRLFAVRAGTARRRGRAIQLLAPDAHAATAVRLGWRPTPALARAQELRVALRAPAGTRVRLLLAGPGEGPSVRVAQAGDEREPGTATVSMPLPAGWYERLADGRLQLGIEVPAAPADAAAADTDPARRATTARAWFDGMSLVFGPGGAHGAAKTGRPGDADG